MLPKKFVSLLICCSLVLGAFAPQNTKSSSEISTHKPLSFSWQIDDLTADLVASARTSSTITADQYPDSPQAECQSIAYGQTVYGSIDVGGEVDCFTFPGQVNDLPYAQLDSPDSIAYQLTLSGPGILTQSCTSYDTCQIYDVTLTTSGDHTLTVTSAAFGPYSLYLGLLSAPPQNISYGETVTGTISTPGIIDIYEFNGVADDQVNAYLNSPIGAEFYLKLNMPDGSSFSCFSYESCLIDNVTLPTTGVYTLLVGGSGTYTGSYNLSLGSSQPVGMSLGETRTIQITPAMPFTVHIDVPSNTEDLFITLQKFTTWTSEIELSKGGQVLISEELWMDQILQLPSPAAGSYDLRVSGSGEGKLSVLETLPELPLGQWVVGTIYNEYGLAWYQVEVPAGQDSLNFYAEALGTISQLQVYKNTIDSTPNWSDSGSTLNIEILTPDPGRYYVQLRDSALVIGDTQERDHLIKADISPIEPPSCTHPTISSFSPTSGGRSAPVTITINGQCFEPQANVCLTRAGLDDVCSDFVTVADNGRSLAATFNFSLYVDSGDWTPVVTNPDLKSAAAPAPFTVENEGMAKIWLEVLGREQLRAGRTTPYFVRFGNDGNVDLYDAILILKFPVGLEYDLPEIETTDNLTIPLGIEQDGYTLIPIWLIRLDAGSQQEVRVDIRVPEDSPIPTGSEIEISSEFYSAPRSDFSNTGNPNYLDSSPTFQNIVNATVSALRSQGYPVNDTLVSEIERALLGIVLDRLKSNYTSLIVHLLKGVLISLGFSVAAQVLVVGAAIYSILGWIKNILDPKSPYVKFASLLSKVISSESPEDKFGPSGYDPPGLQTAQKQRWISADWAMDYRIDFWNKEDALAATVDVIITDTLDTDLDWSSFSFTEIGFLDWQVPLEPTQYFNVDVTDVSIDLSAYYPGEPVVEMVVNVEGIYDASTGYIEWHFHTLDPITRQPPENPYAGFLPPFTYSGWEIGWVEFSVAQQTGLASGTDIQNQAFVKFDLNKFNPAPKEGPFINTVDSIFPTSTAQISSSLPQCSGVLVTWTAKDDQNGSGLHSVDLYVDDLSDSNPPYLYQGSVQEGWLTFNGIPGRGYGFFTRARDNVGNLEPALAPLTYDAQVTVDSYCLFAPMGLLNYK